MIVVYMKGTKNRFFAVGEYEPDKKAFIVKKGSTVSGGVSHAPTFRAADTIEKERDKYTVDNEVVEDITFKSPSTAANFISGTSTNGMISWKDATGETLKTILFKMGKI